MDSLINEYYEMFKGLPNHGPIIRNNIKEDAFTVAVLDIMYNKRLNLDFTDKNVESIAKYIVAPPDSGIDIFVEYEDGDEYYFDIIQVKYTKLGQQDIKQCLAVMQRAINDYLKDPQSVHKNLRKVISNTNFDRTCKNNCTYYVVHIGEINYANGLKKFEKVVTLNELKIVKESLGSDCVPKDVLKSDGFNNFISYSHNNDEDTEQAYLCNLNGYDLAKLSNKYTSTEVGKNILFGQNLRDSLEDKSKTFKSMEYTIDNEPEKFWFYNNGITIIAEGFNAVAENTKDNEQNTKKIDSVTLENFSIINGAQTTSSLGIYLKQAEINSDEEKINKLKNVYVLTRILVINKPELKDNISIYNNMQNPITTRDMVSNRLEQKKLYEWLISGDKPNIFVEIRRGSRPPSHVKLLKHQMTTNEALAQLAFASFFREPYTAKDKKRTLFNNDYSKENFTINEDYHKIFHFDDENDKCGILFKKTKSEIDELLFVAYLYKESKTYLKKVYQQRLDKQHAMLKNADEDERQNINEFINNFTTQMAINNICFFYCIALYYEFKAQFDEDEDSNKTFNYSEFYNGKNNKFKQTLIESFSQIFLSKTIEIIKTESAGTANVGNWIRSKKSQDIFMKKLRNELSVNLAFAKEYKNFVNEFKH